MGLLNEEHVKLQSHCADFWSLVSMAKSLQKSVRSIDVFFILLQASACTCMYHCEIWMPSKASTLPSNIFWMVPYITCQYDICEQYILQPTESSLGTRNKSSRGQKMAMRSGWHSNCWQYVFDMDEIQLQMNVFY